MKKITAIFLALLMVCSVFAVPVTASAEVKEKCPVIFIAGSSVDFVDADGNPVSAGFDVITDDDEGEGISREKIIESALNILLPFLVEGLPEDKWDNYGKALYEELAPIWDETRLTGDGNSKPGIGVSPDEIAYWDKIAATVNHGKDGSFGVNDYKFRYDWRLSPYDHVDRLHQFIKTVIDTTGCSQVALVGRCLGGNVITAYLDKYGSERLVKKVVFDEVMSNGSTIVNDCFSGNIDISDKHLQSYVVASEIYGKQDIGLDLVGFNDLLLEIIDRTLDLMTQLGLADGLFVSVESLYNRLYKAFMPAILKATGIGTWASYWTSLCDEDFDTALNLIFGEEGSAERAEYKGLTDKILYLRERIVKPRTIEGDRNLYKVFEKEYGVSIAVVAGYGLPLAPVGVHHDDTSDITVDTRSSSFGATTAGLFDTLSEEYIQERIDAGYGDYISPDGKIDASTCLFPETTWFIKNKHHDSGAGWFSIAEYFTQYTNVTASKNNRNISRFLIVDSDNVNSCSNMTTENMKDGPWLQLIEQEPTTVTVLFSLFRLLTTLLKILTQLINGTFVL